MRRSACHEIDEEFYAGRCAQGAEVWIIPKGHARQIVVQLRVGLGGLHRLDGVDAMGIAHFIEHRLFEKAYGDMSDRFAALGGDVNASTGLASTDYTVSCSSHWEEHIDMLCELVFAGYWDGEAIARERDIVASEIKLYQDDPDWVGYHSCLYSAYGEQAIVREIAGDEALLSGLDADLLQRWHAAYYRPENTSLFVSGNVDPHRVVVVFEEALRRHGKELRAGTRRSSPRAEPPDGALPAVSTPAAVRYPQVFMAFPDGGPRCPPRTIGRELALEIALDMAMGPASDAFARLYESGLVLGDSFSAEVHLEQAYGFCMIAAETHCPDSFVEAVYRALSADWRSDEWGEDFTRARRKVYGQVVRSFESADGCVEMMSAARQLGGQPFDYVQLLRQLSMADVADGFAYCLNTRRAGVAHLNPMQVPV